MRDGRDKPVALLFSEGQMSNYKGPALLLPVLPKAKELLADRGYDTAWFGAAPQGKEYYALHSAQEEPQNPDRIRQGTLQATPQG